MPLSFEMELTERLVDRVIVAVSIVPGEQPAEVDEVMLQLTTRQGEPLSPRLLLPVSGAMVGALLTTAELRFSGGEIPPGARVIASLWGSNDLHLEATCPADAWTELAAHVRGHSLTGIVTRDVSLRTLDMGEREAILQRLPWLAKCCSQPADGPLEATAEHDTYDPEDTGDFVDALGLDSTDADFLKELLQEP